MASEESRRVADYFVVCGLPKNNPQLLDDSSLEVSLRSTAHQDPITDITVSDISSCFRYICSLITFPSKLIILLYLMYCMQSLGNISSPRREYARLLPANRGHTKWTLSKFKPWVLPSTRGISVLSERAR